MNTLLMAIKKILKLTLPAIKALIISKVVPVAKRKAYEALDKKADKLIKDLAQNASKIKNADNEHKSAYFEGTMLGVKTLRLLGEKFQKAADEIEKEVL